MAGMVEVLNLTQSEIVGGVKECGRSRVGVRAQLQTYAASAPFATCSCTGSLAANETFVH
jgi:hypothetical protein